MNTLSEAHSIITISPQRLGDTLFITPLMRLLKTHYPHLQIDVIAQTPLAYEALKYNPYIHELFLQPTLEAVNKMAETYDFAFSVHNEPRGNIYETALKRNWIEYIPPQQPGFHATERLLKFYTEKFNLPLTHFKANYDLFPQTTHYDHITRLLKSYSVDPHNDILIGYHLGCHGLAKKRTRLWNVFGHKKAWPLKSYIALTKRLKQAHEKVRIVLTGSQAEIELGKIFCQTIPDTINLINQTTVLDLAALMPSLKLFLSNDTGVLHVACSCETLPIIALFGGSDPILTGPFPNMPHRMVFFDPHIAKIPVDTVFGSIKI